MVVRTRQRAPRRPWALPPAGHGTPPPLSGGSPARRPCQSPRPRGGANRSRGDGGGGGDAPAGDTAPAQPVGADLACVARARRGGGEESHGQPRVAEAERASGVGSDRCLVGAGGGGVRRYTSPYPPTFVGLASAAARTETVPARNSGRDGPWGRGGRGGRRLSTRAERGHRWAAATQPTCYQTASDRRWCPRLASSHAGAPPAAVGWCGGGVPRRGQARGRAAAGGGCRRG